MLANHRFLLRVVCLGALLAPRGPAQSLPAFQWIKELSDSHTDSLAGLGTDAQGNTYAVGSTLSGNFPTKAAIQSHSGSGGLYRIDSASAWTALGLSSATSIAAVPLNPSILYAAANNRVVRSNDGGATFATLYTGAQVAQVAVDPNNSQTVYAAANDAGVLKSTDGGATWVASNSGIVAQPNGQVSVGKLWIDPANSKNLYAAGFQVLAHSTDAGATWKTVSTGYLAVTLNFDTHRAGVVYLSTFPNAILVSVDGDTFAPLAGAPASLFQVLSDPNSNGRLIGVGNDGIYESTDSGASWARKLSAGSNVLAVPGLTPDWSRGVLYGVTQTQNIVQVPADLSGIAPAAPARVAALTSLSFTGGRLYATAYATRDVYAMKLDALGNIVWSTYFGGAGDDIAEAMTVDAAGNVFVVGISNSANLPVSKGAYAAAGNIFVLRLNSDGTLGYSTYFPSSQTTPSSIAVDAAGSVWISGTTSGGLPVTPGAWQPTFCCHPIPTLFLTIPVAQSFLTRFDAAGSSLIFSTYVGDGSSLGLGFGGGSAIALASDGSAYVAATGNGGGSIYHINASGTALLGSVTPAVSPTAMHIAPDGGLYVAGLSEAGFQPSAGAFQTTLPASPALPSQGAITTGTAIVKFDAELKNVVASTWFAGTGGNEIKALAVDAASNVYAGGDTGSSGLPTRTPLAGSFGTPEGFLAELSGDLSSLVFSSYFGAAGGFTVTGIGVGANSQVVLGGATGSFAGNLASVATNVWLNSISIAPPPALRIDAVDNAASLLDVPVSSGETIVVKGAGFTDHAALTIGGTPVRALAIAPDAITAVVPAGIPANAAAVQVQVDGALSNSVLVPVAAAAPGIFAAGHNGVGQGYILNQDGTLNTPSNPASPGQRITVFATGVGPVSFTDCCAVTQFPVDVFVDGFYCNGVGAAMGPVAGFPGDVYQITVFVPNPADLVANNPNLKNFRFPSLVGLTMRVNGLSSQNGIAISIAQ